MKNELIKWLQAEQRNLDKAIANAAQKYYETHKSEPNFQYDLNQCHHESYNLIQKSDLCYDRPSTAFVYSLWYHPRRVNTFLSFFLDKVLEQQERHMEVFDLGAGTGAIQWGLGLIYAGLKRFGIVPPRITIINIDSSPFMLHYSKGYLWQEFLELYPEIDNKFIIEYEVNSWSNEQRLETSNTILVASYLFDVSDDTDTIANDFRTFVNKYNPNTVLLLTSHQEKKINFANKVARKLVSLGFSKKQVDDTQLICNGNLDSVNKLRAQLSDVYCIDALKRKSSWSDKSHYGIILQKLQSEMVFSDDDLSIEAMDIYNPPMTFRRDINLNSKQKRAAVNTRKPTIIVGPAGCGKSIVITEKVKNIVEQADYMPDMKILVTTFNRELIGRLGDWLKDILDLERCSFVPDIKNDGEQDKPTRVFFKGSNQTNIRLLHFDKLPSELGKVRYTWHVDKNEHICFLEEIIEQVKTEEKGLTSQYDNILNPFFLMEEYHRVIYGLQVDLEQGEEAYLMVTRRGRGNKPSLHKNSKRRKLVWKCLKEYHERMKLYDVQSFTSRRQQLLTRLKSGKLEPIYDFILIDEFQDCTEADFEIFYALIKNPNNLTMAGDLAQSIHLGMTARIPRDERMSKRRFYRLEGSYRLPVRISECIRRIAEVIVERYGNDEGVTEIIPYKGSPPGSRPIVIYGSSNMELAHKIRQVFDRYKIYDLERITVLEKDKGLERVMDEYGIATETDTILSLKGLEKECVLWSTRIPLEFEKEVFEFAYTILTRTSCILIIALTYNTQHIYRKILGLLDTERLIMWDEETASKFYAYREEYQPETIVDEDVE